MYSGRTGGVAVWMALTLARVGSKRREGRGKEEEGEVEEEGGKEEGGRKRMEAMTTAGTRSESEEEKEGKGRREGGREGGKNCPQAAVEAVGL